MRERERERERECVCVCVCHSDAALASPKAPRASPWPLYSFSDYDGARNASPRHTAITDQQKICFNWRNLEPLWGTHTRERRPTTGQASPAAKLWATLALRGVSRAAAAQATSRELAEFVWVSNQSASPGVSVSWRGLLGAHDAG